MPSAPPIPTPLLLQKTNAKSPGSFTMPNQALSPNKMSGQTPSFQAIKTHTLDHSPPIQEEHGDHAVVGSENRQDGERQNNRYRNG